MYFKYFVSFWEIKVYELDSKFNYLSNNFFPKSSFPIDAHIIHFNAFMGKPCNLYVFIQRKTIGENV